MPPAQIGSLLTGIPRSRDLLASPVNVRSDEIPHGSEDAHGLEAYAGTYTDAGYGTWVLCSTGRPSSACRHVLSAFEKKDGRLADDAIYGYFRSPTLLAKEIRLAARKDRTSFMLHATTLFPDGYGADSAPFEVDLLAGAAVQARFQLNGDGSIRGFGLFGLAGPVLEREREMETIEGQAEVWFNRVAWPGTPAAETAISGPIASWCTSN
jgi:hypothetical protein